MLRAVPIHVATCVRRCALALFVAVLLPLTGTVQADPIRIGSTATGHLVWIADARGYFNDAGVDVELTEFSSGVAASKALLEGKVDMANSSEFAFVSTVMRQPNLRIVASIARVSSAVLFARKDRGIASVHDLIGHNIGLTRGSIGEFYLGEYLTINGLTFDDVQLVNLPAPEIVEAIAAGNLDAAITWDPNVYRARQALGDNFYALPEQDSYFYHFLLFGAQNYINANPSAVTQVLKALVRAEKFARAQPKAAQDIIAARFKLDPAFVRDTWKTSVREVTLQQTLISLMEQESRWRIENKMNDAGSPPNFLEVIDAAPLEAAAPGAVQLIR